MHGDLFLRLIAQVIPDMFGGKPQEFKKKKKKRGGLCLRKKKKKKKKKK